MCRYILRVGVTGVSSGSKLTKEWGEGISKIIV